MTKNTITYGSLVVSIISLVAIFYYGILSFNASPVIDFDYQQVAKVGEVVTFANASSVQDPTIGWNWEFGDGSENVSAVSAKHAFPAPGRFVVTLSIPNGGDTLMRQKIVQITQPQLVAAFDVEVSSAKTGDSLKVSNNSQHASDFVWYLGDGRNMQGKEPPIIYSNPGDYELTLVAINSVGQSSQYSMNVSIVDAGSAPVRDVQNEVIVKHIAIFDEQALSSAFTKLANTKMARSGKRKIRNDILRDVSSINILVNDLTLENYLNKIQLEASRKEVEISVSAIIRDSNNKISSITIN